jgi:hypothetical protein
MKLRLGRIPAQYYVFFSSLALFLFSLQRNFSAAHDSITYLNHITEGNHLFHPHHLLYNFVSRCGLLIGRFLIPGAADYILIEILSAVFGSAVLTTCFLFLRNRANLPAGFSSIATVVIAFSYGVWSYSTNIEVYAPSIWLSLLVLYTITSPVLNGRKLFQSALYTTLAILFHQVHVLLLLVSLFYFSRKLQREQHSRIVTFYFLPVLVFTVFVYLLVAVKFEGVRSISEFFSWATLYAHGHDYWRSPAIGSIVLAATGFIRSFFGGQFLFRLTSESNAASGLFKGHNLSDENYLVRNLQQWQAVLLTVIMLVALVVMLKFIVEYFRNRAYKNEVLHPLQYSFIIYSCFFFFWMPENLEFWIFQSILFWLILFSSPATVVTKKRNIQAAIIASCLFIVNYGGSIFWLQDKKNDWYYSAIQPLIPTATSSDLVICKDPWIMDDYVHHYTDSRQPESQDSKSLLIDIEQTLQAGKRVFVISAQDSQSPEARRLDSTLQSYSMRMKLFSPGIPPIYVIR